MKKLSKLMRERRQRRIELLAVEIHKQSDEHLYGCVCQGPDDIDLAEARRRLRAKARKEGK